MQEKKEKRNSASGQKTASLLRFASGAEEEEEGEGETIKYRQVWQRRMTQNGISVPARAALIIHLLANEHEILQPIGMQAGGRASEYLPSFFVHAHKVIMCDSNKLTGPMIPPDPILSQLNRTELNWAELNG